MKYFLIVSITIVGFTLGIPVLKDVETEWIKFKVQYGKQYKSLFEENERKQIFSSNYETIIKHNKLYEQGLETYFMNTNERADMTVDEMRHLNGFKNSVLPVGPIEEVVFKPKEEEAIPESFDWREKGAVTKVKNQYGCGSCWAFSSTGVLEGQYFLKTGKLVQLSEQNLVDCSHNDNNIGCDGGVMISSYKYIHENDGIDNEIDYPYVGIDRPCRYDVKNNVTSVKGYGIIEKGNEDHLKAAIAQIGPIAVAIDASHIGFYSGGIYYDKKCKVDPDDLNHAVLAVGYGTENDQDYWLVKNSWGSNFGVSGYIKMSRNRDNNCGIATNASYPIMY